MTTAELAAAIRAGRSVTDVAIDAGLTPSAVYLRLRRAGTPVRSLQRQTRAETRPIPDLPGYRATSTGAIESCVLPRSGEHSEHWRALSIQTGSKGGLYVQIGSSANGRRRLSLRGLLVSAWGERRGEEIFGRVMGR